jgi:acyl-coenzyme A synthetase/AMP-(fatty) acid ligase
MYLPFTSGTTGRPKAVLHSDNTLLATARMMARDWHLGLLRDLEAAGLAKYACRNSC